MISGTSTADDEDPFAEERRPPFVTNTVLDEFIPVYQQLACWTTTHGPFSPEEVDAMDISTVAALLGVDSSAAIGVIHDQWVREYAAMNPGWVRPD